MSNGHRNHSFHHRKDVQPPHVSSDNQSLGYDDNTGNDYRNVSVYNTDSHDQTGSGYNPCNGYRPGSVYNACNACNDYRPGSAYNNVLSDYRTISAYNAGFQKGYDAGSDYQQDRPSESKYERTPKEEKHDKPVKHVGELGAMAAGGYALNERPEAKADPDHAPKHNIIKEEVAAVASGGYNQKKLEGKLEAINRRKQRSRSL